MAEPTYASGTERVQTRLDGRTLHIRFNNPARHNALSVDMWEAVPPPLQLARDDDRVLLVVFSGAGEKAFVSGADISQFEDMRAARDAVAHYERMAEATLTGIHDFPKPALACIHGYCIDAAEAKALGLVSRLCAPEALAGLLAEYALVLGENAPLTVMAGKGVTREILKASPDIDMELCAALIRGCFESADYAEGRTAFMQKRKPVFTGR